MKATLLSTTILLTGLLLIGCTRRIQAPPSTAIIGTFQLVEVDGNTIPAEVTHGSSAVRIESGQIEFDSQGTCISRTVFGPPKGENIHREVRADCDYDGQTVDLTWHGAGRTRGEFAGEEFTMNNEGMMFRYRKVSNTE